MCTCESNAHSLCSLTLVLTNPNPNSAHRSRTALVSSGMVKALKLVTVAGSFPEDPSSILPSRPALPPARSSLPALVASSPTRGSGSTSVGFGLPPRGVWSGVVRGVGLREPGLDLTMPPCQPLGVWPGVVPWEPGGTHTRGHNKKEGPIKGVD